MNETSAINQVVPALEDAGKSQETINRLMRLEKRRITPNTVIPKREFLFRMFGKPCFAKGELVALTGKEKSGKTFVTSLLMALCMRREVLGVERISDKRQSVLWFDTEQSEESTQEILTERIMPMCCAVAADEEAADTEVSDGLPERLMNVFNVRSEPWRERLPLLEEAINAYRPDLVVLDGIRDLVDDINDGVLAQKVIERLMRLASECGCCIVCVLHQNKSVADRNLRGWIGTELANKSFEVYECSKDTDRVFSFRQTHTRKYDITETLRFSVDDEGIPQPGTSKTAKVTAASRPRKAAEHDPINSEYVDETKACGYLVDFRKLFADVLPPGVSIPAKEVMTQAMELAGIQVPTLYRRLKAAALKENVVERSFDGHGREVLTRPLEPRSPGEPPSDRIPLTTPPYGGVRIRSEYPPSRGGETTASASSDGPSFEATESPCADAIFAPSEPRTEHDESAPPGQPFARAKTIDCMSQNNRLCKPKQSDCFAPNLVSYFGSGMVGQQGSNIHSPKRVICGVGQGSFPSAPTSPKLCDTAYRGTLVRLVCSRYGSREKRIAWSSG